MNKLKAGQTVNFEIIQGPKGLHAVNICAEGQTRPEAEPVTVGQPTPVSA